MPASLRSVCIARRVLPAAAAAALLLLSMPAHAQQGSDPLGFLKPWIEKQIFGKEEPQPAQPPADAAPPAGADATHAPTDAGADDSAAPAAEDRVETEGAPAAEDGTGDTDPALRGADQGEDADTPGVPAAAAAEAPAETPAVAATPGPEPLRLAILAGRSSADTLSAVGPIAEDLGRLLARPVEFVPFPSYDAVIDAQVDRRIDGGFYSAPAFAVAESRCTCIDPIVAPRAADGTLAYHAVIVVRADAGIGALSGLAGKTVAVGAADSIGARRMQLAALTAEGFDPATGFGSVVETESAEDAVRLLADGRVDAAFAWSSLAGNAASGYSRGTLADLAATGVAVDRLAVLWKSPPIGHGPFALASSLADADKAKVRDYLVALATANPSTYDRLDPYYGGGYAPVDPQDYSGLSALAEANADALPTSAVAQPDASAAGQAGTAQQ